MNISEFRKDLSKHFNEAVQGRPVYITRAGQMFKLEAYYPPEGGTEMSFRIKTSKDNDEYVMLPTLKKNKSVGKPTNEFCPHGNMEKLCPKCGSKTVVIDSTPVGPNAFHKLTTDKVSSNVRPDIEQAKVNAEANMKADAIRYGLAGVSHIKQCPHGYAIGMCKKSDCNRKYKK